MDVNDKPRPMRFGLKDRYFVWNGNKMEMKKHFELYVAGEDRFNHPETLKKVKEYINRLEAEEHW